MKTMYIVCLIIFIGLFITANAASLDKVDKAETSGLDREKRWWGWPYYGLGWGWGSWGWGWPYYGWFKRTVEHQ